MATRDIGKCSVHVLDEDMEGNVRIVLTLSPLQLARLIHAPPPELQTKRDLFEHVDVTPATEKHSPLLDLVYQSGLSNRLIVPIGRMYLGAPNITSTDIEPKFEDLNRKVAQWRSRKVDEKFQGLFIHVGKLDRTTSLLLVVGLNESNHFVILHAGRASKSDVLPVLKELVSRGLRPVRFGVVGTDVEVQAAFHKVFPKATIQLCWSAVIKTFPMDQRDDLKALSNASNQKAFKTELHGLKRNLQDELKPYLPYLTTYQEFPKPLWRSIKTLNPIYRLEGALKRNLNPARNEEEFQTILDWVSLRQHYQWSKIPVDAAQLSNLQSLKRLEKQSR